MAGLDAVNEGALEFLAERPDGPVHHHHNRITLTSASVRTGWVRLVQCHDHLDAVSRAEVVFREGGVRDLEITESRSIGRARVDGPSVQLTDVRPGARLCLRAYTHALRREEGGGLLLRNGPYMRRFLDGYYPMHVSVELKYPCGSLRVMSVRPVQQPGFRVAPHDCGLSLDAWFRGRLTTEVRLMPSGRAP